MVTNSSMSSVETTALASLSSSHINSSELSSSRAFTTFSTTGLFKSTSRRDLEDAEKADVVLGLVTNSGLSPEADAEEAGDAEETEDGEETGGGEETGDVEEAGVVLRLVMISGSSPAAITALAHISSSHINSS